MKNLSYGVLLAICGVVLYWALAATGLITKGEQDSEETVVYLCGETNKVVVGPPQPTPAVNPATGRRTLVRALYCGQCQKWRAIPPSELFGGHPRSVRCPKHGTPLSPEGPVDDQ